MIHLYRIDKNGGVAHIDSLHQSTPAMSYVLDNYLPDSRDGERYFTISSITGRVDRQWVVETTRDLLEVS